MKQVGSFFFGSNAQLFGMYHPATGYSCSHGVVICAPLFHEYYRSQYTIRRIAIELSSRGYDVLRFDYSGTGDSKGEIPSDMFEVWRQDVGEAIAELRALSGHASMSLVAIRYSATLGLPWQGEVSNFVCWDPIVNHRRYAEQVDAINSLSMAEHTTMSAEELATPADSDYLCIGWTRTSFERKLAEFADRLEAQGLRDLPEQCIAITSDTDWVAASLETIYAHETVKQVTAALQGR